MMTARQAIKYWLYGSCPGFAGSFRYFGIRIYFPKRALLFRAACEQGVFEADNVRLLQGLVRPGSYFFDVGANIGLMSVPVLYCVRDVRAVSFEPSPNTLPHLRRTIEQSSLGDRWTLIPKAVGMETGQVTFSVANPENGAYDGLRNTRRVEEATQATVEVTTLDHEWERLGRPQVSAIKIDVEGGELAVLQGALDLLKQCRPFVLLEWNKTNLKPYDVTPRALSDFAHANDFLILALPHLNPVATAAELEVQLLQTESFLLIPAKGPNENS